MQPNLASVNACQLTAFLDFKSITCNMAEENSTEGCPHLFLLFQKENKEEIPLKWVLNRITSMHLKSETTDCTLKLYALSAESHYTNASKVLTTEVCITYRRQQGFYKAKCWIQPFVCTQKLSTPQLLHWRIKSYITH